jgi:hemoglobin-like flavoprotein
MTPQQIALVRSTFSGLAPASGEVAALFYARLFALDPSLRPLFRGSMEEQGGKLMQVLSAAVAGLDRIGLLLPQLHALGRRHADYGVADHHYDTVGAALLDTLARGLGDDFTPAVRDAWLAAYTTLAGAMRAGVHIPVL